MPLLPADWHNRFAQQARWTQELRAYLFDRAGLQKAQRVLDLGCGTGVLVNELEQRVSAQIFGLDINSDYLQMAMRNSRQVSFSLGDAHTLPFQNATFDISFCHFLLLWVAYPVRVVSELRRVTHPGGSVLALAEPDYGGRIDFPAELSCLGEWQQASLRHQGADPQIGRRLASIFHAAGLTEIETGVLGNQQRDGPSQEEWKSEWAMLQADLADSVSEEILARLRLVDTAAWQAGERVLFVPTFYAWGRVL